MAFLLKLNEETDRSFAMGYFNILKKAANGARGNKGVDRSFRLFIALLAFA